MQNHWVHLATGIVFCLLVPAHLLTPIPMVRAAVSGRLRTWRTAGAWTLGGVFVAMLVSGIVQWMGSEAAIALHAGTGVAIVAVVAVHVWGRRSRLWPASSSRRRP